MDDKHKVYQTKQTGPLRGLNPLSSSLLSVAKQSPGGVHSTPWPHNERTSLPDRWRWCQARLARRALLEVSWSARKVGNSLESGKAGAEGVCNREFKLHPGIKSS